MRKVVIVSLSVAQTIAAQHFQTLRQPCNYNVFLCFSYRQGAHDWFVPVPVPMDIHQQQAKQAYANTVITENGKAKGLPTTPEAAVQLNCAAKHLPHGPHSTTYCLQVSRGLAIPCCSCHSAGRLVSRSAVHRQGPATHAAAKQSLQGILEGAQ